MWPYRGTRHTFRYHPRSKLISVDLCRYFGGEVNYSTIRAHALEHFEGPGKLSKLSIDESSIPPERRIPRMTVASWKFESGAVCNFTHGLVLHGSRYDTTLEVYCDGWSFRLVDPYK
jgi:Putative oxidoreductase C terminal domain